ncbi:MAG: cobyrinate a,c-diamide synthase, partial [Chloroflexota bacterium]
MTAKLLIAGTNSGVGKTTITMGLIAALRRHGQSIQPFKAGPDYIDPTYHTLAAGRSCRNIDTWMVPPSRALSLFDQAVQTADLAVIEGVMGVFDGFSYETEEGSSAQIAKLTGAPVLLVLDVGKMARSAGAIAYGYTNFDPDLTIAGFILNRCGSQSHYEGVKLAVEQATQRPVVGWLPKDADLHIPERHLGLVPTDERGELTSFINHAADVIEQYFDLEQILALANNETDQREGKPPLNPPQKGRSASPSLKQSVSKDYSQSPINLAIARDAAFSFYYEDNLDLLREAGAKITFFSPLTDTDLPPNTHGIYLGGGFPEMFPAQLATNASIKTALQQARKANIPIYAECGGFMYLTEAIIDLDGETHPMVGLVPGITRMQPRLVSLGYRIVESFTGNFLLPQGITTRGHEFHWSTWETPSNHSANSQTTHSITNNQSPIPPAWHI